MEKDFYVTDRFPTIGDAIKNLQQIALNIGEDSSCFYTVTVWQDTVRWGENIVISKEMANDIVNNLWFYNQSRKALRECIENELNLQLEKTNLTLKDFEIK